MKTKLIITMLLMTIFTGCATYKPSPENRELNYKEKKELYIVLLMCSKEEFKKTDEYRFALEEEQGQLETEASLKAADEHIKILYRTITKGDESELLDKNCWKK